MRLVMIEQTINIEFFKLFKVVEERLKAKKAEPIYN